MHYFNKIFSASVLTAALLVAAAPAAFAADPGDEYGPSASYEQAPVRTGVLWLDADAGFQLINLETFKANEQKLTAGIIPSSGFGPSATFGLGVRLVFLTLGIRARVGAFNDSSLERTVGNWQMWSLDGEVGLRIPLGHVEPYLRFDAGYTTLGSFDQAIEGLGQGLDVNGFNLGATAGFDYFVTNAFTLGLAVGGDLLFLSRPGVAIRDLATPQQVATLNEAKERILQGNGSSVGSSLTFSGGAGLHF